MLLPAEKVTLACSAPNNQRLHAVCDLMLAMHIERVKVNLEARVRGGGRETSGR